MSKKFTEEQLKKAGVNVAALWGAEVISWEYLKEEKTYRFLCVEHGEQFYVDLDSEDILKYL